MAMDDPFDDDEMDARLRDDPDGEYRAGLMSRLRRMRDACDAARRQLQDRESFRRLQAASAAVEAAITAVELVARRGNP
jgi:hypothetical protein